MKIRNGFVSNSSSSSFIVNIKAKVPNFINNIPNECYSSNKDLSEFDTNARYRALILPCKNGKHEFGWEEERTYDTIDKLNYLAIQVLSLGENESYGLRQMIEEAINEVDRDVRVYWDYNSVKWDSPGQFASIDHQSKLGYDSLHKIFKDKESIKNFIFNDDAYIQGGNDNGGNESNEYMESLANVYGNIYLIHQVHEQYDSWGVSDADIKHPVVEGTCKDCSSDVAFQLLWYKEDGTPINKWDDMLAYYGMTEEEFSNTDGRFGYYRCTNPNCKNHKRTFVSDEGCDSEHIPYINWNENILGIKLEKKKVYESTQA